MNIGMIIIGILTALGLYAGNSFWESLGVAVGCHFVACIVTGIIMGVLRK